jgi:hypothetical protein
MGEASGATGDAGTHLAFTILPWWLFPKICRRRLAFVEVARGVSLSASKWEEV